MPETRERVSVFGQPTQWHVLQFLQVKNHFGITATVFFHAVEYRAFVLLYDFHIGFLRNGRVQVMFVVGDQKHIVVGFHVPAAVVQHRRHTFNIGESGCSTLSFVKGADFQIVFPVKAQQVIRVCVLLVIIYQTHIRGAGEYAVNFLFANLLASCACVLLKASAMSMVLLSPTRQY